MEFNFLGVFFIVVNLDKLVFFSFVFELGGSVMDKIKGKVWVNEYVDFGVLFLVILGFDCYFIFINNLIFSLGVQFIFEFWKFMKKIIYIN